MLCKNHYMNDIFKTFRQARRQNISRLLVKQLPKGGKIFNETEAAFI